MSLELMDFIVLTAIYIIIMGGAATAYYLDQRAFKVETIAKFEKLMLAWEGRLSRVAGKFEGVEVPETSLTSFLGQMLINNPGVQGYISHLIAGGLNPKKKKEPPKEETEE